MAAQSFLTPLLAITLCGLGIAVAQAPANPAASNEELIKAMLLATPSWRKEAVDTKANADKAFTNASWDETIAFVMKDGELVAKLQLRYFTDACVSKVTLMSDGFAYDGCRDRKNTLRFDPSDTAYPFKGFGLSGTNSEDIRFRPNN